MELNKKILKFITALSFLLVLVMDHINITQYIKYISHIDNTISNIITFISILIGFISAIYVMILQTQDSYVLKLLKDLNLINMFNKSFKSLMCIGFIDVILLILINFLADYLIMIKWIIYLTFPLTIYFLLASYNIITIICKMISSENKLKKLDLKVEEKDIK